MEIDDIDENMLNNTTGRNRNKKNVENIKNMDEQSRNHIKQMKLCILEEDDVGYKEE